mmetsp:Transcript_35496/g.40321  ORF Transcript_35496/g.40321 Transcript_35496/m.40321 type:complete len:244 (+) Transcript_35496:795-1526(+)
MVNITSKFVGLPLLIVLLLQVNVLSADDQDHPGYATSGSDEDLSDIESGEMQDPPRILTGQGATGDEATRMMGGTASDEPESAAESFFNLLAIEAENEKIYACLKLIDVVWADAEITQPIEEFLETLVEETRRDAADKIFATVVKACLGQMDLDFQVELGAKFYEDPDFVERYSESVTPGEEIFKLDSYKLTQEETKLNEKINTVIEALILMEEEQGHADDLYTDVDSPDWGDGEDELEHEDL